MKEELKTNENNGLPGDKGSSPLLFRRDVLIQSALGAFTLGMGTFTLYTIFELEKRKGIAFDDEAPRFKSSHPTENHQVFVEGTIVPSKITVRSSILPSLPVVPTPNSPVSPKDVGDKPVINQVACYNLTVVGNPTVLIELRCIPGSEATRILDRSSGDHAFRVHGVVRLDPHTKALYIYCPWIVHPVTGEPSSSQRS